MNYVIFFCLNSFAGLKKAKTKGSVLRASKKKKKKKITVLNLKKKLATILKLFRNTNASVVMNSIL